MSGVNPAHHEDGSTVVELLVAATLTSLAIAMLIGNGLPALRLLEAPVATERRMLELTTAADVAARAVRAARPDVARDALRWDGDDLLVALGSGGELRLLFDADALMLQVEGAHARATTFPDGMLVAGLDIEHSSFMLLDEAGAEASGADRVSAVVITLADEDVEVVSVVTPRLMTHLDGGRPW